MGVTRRTVLKALAATGAGAIAGPAAYGYLVGRHELEVTRARVPVTGLPAALAGLRIGLLTDVHRSYWVSHDDVTRAVNALMLERPDLIVLGGDYVTYGDREYVGPSADALAPLAAPQGVFAILGNHDDDHDMPAALGRKGIQVLKDARTRLTIRREPLDLVGIRFWTKKQIDIAALTRDAAPATILLSHDPRRLSEAAALDIPLVLAGHTHGGQFFPWTWAAARVYRQFTYGLRRLGNLIVYTSSGAGTWGPPLRVGTQSEIVLIQFE